MLTGQSVRTALAADPPDDAGLRGLVVDFLALNQRPGCWTFFHAAAPAGPMTGRPAVPDLVLDVGGRIAYVEIRCQGGGPLPPRRAAGLALARARGAACFVVRSLPDMERALRTLGVQLRPGGRLIGEEPARKDRDAPPA